jgi:hypothetical protein
MTAEEQAAEAARVASLTPEEVAAEEAAEAAKVVPYTDDELKTFTPTSHIEMERVPENYRPIIENMTRDYKNLAADHTKKAQELAELKRVPETETYFEDTKKDGVFKDYLKNPVKVIGEIHAEIAKLEANVKFDGSDEDRQSRSQIAYWNGIKDEFLAKRIEVSEKQRLSEADEAKVLGELGQDAQTLIEFAKTQGFSEKDFKKNKAIREAVSKLYKAENALATASKKETKPNPHKAAAPAGSKGNEGDQVEDDESNLPLAERIKKSEARAGYQ